MGALLAVAKVPVAIMGSFKDQAVRDLSRVASFDCSPTAPPSQLGPRLLTYSYV